MAGFGAVFFRQELDFFDQNIECATPIGGEIVDSEVKEKSPWVGIAIGFGVRLGCE